LRLAIFGGTFDPIHQAHLAIAREAAERCQLDRVLLGAGWQSAAQERHRARPYEHRVRMAEFACRGEAHLEVSRLEEGSEWQLLHRYHRKAAARAWRPATNSFFVIGADAFAEVRTWCRWEDVARRVRFIVVSRPGHLYETPPGVRLERLDTIELPISSSEIRRALAAGERPAEVPEPVLEYILSHGLYGARVPV
jgi:nicotinate-nucleotide adenylyltransferase